MGLTALSPVLRAGWPLVILSSLQPPIGFLQSGFRTSDSQSRLKLLLLDHLISCPGTACSHASRGVGRQPEGGGRQEPEGR